MKKNYFIVILGLLLLYSCEKSEPTKLFLVQENYHFYDANPPIYPYNIKYSYSDDGKLIRRESEGTGRDFYTIYYYSNQVMDSSETYKKVTGVYNISFTTYYTFDSNNNITSLISKGLNLESTYNYNYKNDRIDSIDYEFQDGTYTSHRYFKYLTNDLGNIVWRNYEWFRMKFIDNYEYDDKINPFQKILISPDVNYSDIKYFSPNNCTKEREYFYRYEYNSKGLPVKKYTSWLEDSTLMSDVEYVYAEQ